MLLNLINQAQSMLHASAQQEKTTTDFQPNYVFVLLTWTGKLVIGAANNPCRRIAALNSGLNGALPESHSIKRIIGVKERTEERSLISTVKRLIEKVGEDNIIVV